MCVYLMLNFILVSRVSDVMYLFLYMWKWIYRDMSYIKNYFNLSKSLLKWDMSYIKFF